jgi:hypothetical protein
MSQLAATHLTNMSARPTPLTGAAAPEWLVGFATLDVDALVHGRPGALPMSSGSH